VFQESILKFFLVQYANPYSLRFLFPLQIHLICMNNIHQKLQKLLFKLFLSHRGDPFIFIRSFIHESSFQLQFQDLI